jgi:hypothetical protein
MQADAKRLCLEAFLANPRRRKHIAATKYVQTAVELDLKKMRVVSNFSKVS